MSRQFSLHTVYRMLTNDLLAQFFTQLKNPCYGMDWSKRPRRHVDSVDFQMRWFDPKQRDAAELVLRQVFDLACATGIEAIRRAAIIKECPIVKRLPQDMNLYCQAMWTWLNAPDVFEHAVLYHELEGLAWWKKRDGLPKVVPRTDPEALDWLSADVSRLLSEKQGRGWNCTVEHVSPDDQVDYFFCFPDDYVKTITVHNRSGRLVTKTVRQTFEIVFAYSRTEGTLELSSRLGKYLRGQLEESFAWLMLDEQLAPREPRTIYDLNRIKELKFRLDTDPSDHVFARIQRLTFRLPEERRAITLTSETGSRDDMRDMVHNYLGPRHVGLHALRITAAQIRMHFASRPTRGRGSMTFDVAHPDRSNLRRHRPERVAVARKHLKLWRIES